MVGCEENGERDEEEVGAQGRSWRFAKGQSEAQIASLPIYNYGANEIRLKKSCDLEIPPNEIFWSESMAARDYQSTILCSCSDEA